MADAEERSVPVERELLFPEGLIQWSGDRDGGVRKPFHKSSGRPTGAQIETPLVLRLKDWAEKLAAGEDVPRVVMLVGGPGNGKTDAIEGCVGILDEAWEASGQLVKAFEDGFKVTTNDLAPRRVDVLSSDVGLTEALTISVVQDATEKFGSRSKEECLIEDLSGLLDGATETIYLCGVNRGILATAASDAEREDEGSGVAVLLDVITKAVTSSPSSPSCWPLDGYEHIAVWPMDVESLVDPSLSEDNRSVAHQIFDAALQEDKWQLCKLGERCPFCQNHRVLKRKGSLDSLVQLLHYYELASRKRWTFRDLFSLVPYLLVGDPSELVIKGKQYGPCEWSLHQRALASGQGPAGSDRDRAPFLLMSRLYHHRLFPRWPSLNHGDYFKARRELLTKKSRADGDLVSANALFSFVTASAKIASKASGDVPRRIRESFGELLDPAVATGGPVIMTSDDGDVTIADLEGWFSLSVSHGQESVGRKIETLERDVLDVLRRADEGLMADKFPSNKTAQARLLQSTLRQFAARVVKRSLGTRQGVCRNAACFARYLDAIRVRKKELNDVRKELKALLHDSTMSFKAALATTFGQPLAEQSRNVVLQVQQTVSVETPKPGNAEGRPRESLPYLKIGGYYIALTFPLFHALGEVSRGLHEASLPTEIYSLLDRVKSLVAGRMVRDEKVLADSPVILLGADQGRIEYTDGEFEYETGGVES